MPGGVCVRAAPGAARDGGGAIPPARLTLLSGPSAGSGAMAQLLRAALKRPFVPLPPLRPCRSGHAALAGQAALLSRLRDPSDAREAGTHQRCAQPA